MGLERVWHRHYPPGTPPQVKIERITMPEVLVRTAEEFPDHVAFVYMGRKITFRALDGMVNRFARALLDMDVHRGEKIGLILPNIPQVIIANLAVQRIGAVTVMNNPLYTERELSRQLNDSETRLVVSLDLLFPRLLKIMPETRIETVIVCHINDYLPFPKKQLFPFVKKSMYRNVEPGEHVHLFTDLMCRYPEDPLQNSAQWTDTAVLLYTGGTTGVSKGAELTHANISSVVQQFTAWFPDLEPGKESLLGIYPIFHSAGYSVSQNLTIRNGWTCILIPRPEPDAIIEMLKKYKPTFLPGVPTIYIGLLNSRKFREMDLSFIKGYFAGAAPLAEDTVRQLEQIHGARIHDVYGATENTAFATCTPWRGKAKAGTVGVPLPNTEMKIVDIETGTRECPPGQEGEICVKGPQVMKGYYQKPEETAAVLRDGWFYLGDIGVMDAEGYFSVVDRKKDMIVASGFNVYPNEIDEVLFGHPKIVEACAVGIPDAYRGETVKVYVVKAAGEALTESDVISFCAERLAPYKVPKSVTFMEQLPKSAVGKVLRRKLKEMALSGS